MILAELERALADVEASCQAVSENLLPLAQALVKKPALDLSRLLLGAMALGTADGAGKAIPACRALELLDQALYLGASVSSDNGYDEEKLLVTDYLYGQAIDQVIDAGEPGVIGVLADAIRQAAQNKLESDQADRRLPLTVAALDISLILGDYDAPGRDLIGRMRSSAAAGRADWLVPLPNGRIADFIRGTTLMAAAD